MSTFVTFERPAPRGEISARPAASVPTLAGRLLGLVQWIDSAVEKRRSRRMLLEMTDDQLKDIGISRADAECEAVRSLWR